MDKILITLEVPALDQCFDVYIPNFLTIDELVPLLAQGLKEISEQLYTISGTELLCQCKTNKVMGNKYTLADYGVENGEHLLII